MASEDAAVAKSSALEAPAVIAGEDTRQACAVAPPHCQLHPELAVNTSSASGDLMSASPFPHATTNGRVYADSSP